MHCEVRSTCVHVEDSETHGSTEISDESQDDNGPVGRVYVSGDEDRDEEHDTGGGGATRVGILASNILSQKLK